MFRLRHLRDATPDHVTSLREVTRTHVPSEITPPHDRHDARASAARRCPVRGRAQGLLVLPAGHRRTTVASRGGLAQRTREASRRPLLACWGRGARYARTETTSRRVSPAEASTLISARSSSAVGARLTIASEPPARRVSSGSS